MGVTNDCMDRALLDKVEGMPALAPLVIELLQAIEEPETSFVRISELANRDPVLATRLLRVANSAYFGLPGRVETLSVAVAVIGLRTLKRLLLMMTTREIMDVPLAGYGIEKGGLWSHSLAVAKTSAWLSGFLGYQQEEELWAAGLFHDLGKVIVSDLIESRVTPEHAAVLNGGGYSCVELEREICGLDHAEATAMVGRKWNLSDRLVTVTRHHHVPGDAGGFQKSAAILNAADTIAAHLVAHDGEIGEDLEFSDFTVNTLQLDPGVIGERSGELFESIMDELSFWTGGGDGFDDGGAS